MEEEDEEEEGEEKEQEDVDGMPLKKSMFGVAGGGRKPRGEPSV